MEVRRQGKNQVPNKKGRNCTNTNEARRLQANTVQTAREAVIIYETEITTNIWASKELHKANLFPALGEFQAP